MAALRFLSRNYISQLKNETKPTCTYSLCKRFMSYISSEYAQDKDPAPIYFNPEVQTLLKTLTRVDQNKVFKKRKLGEKQLDLPTYKFMSEEQLEEARKEAIARAQPLLQMPPVIKVRTPVDRVLKADPALKGLDTAKYVFTDISFGVKDSARVVVIRETDGCLKEADWETKDRMNQIYFPKKGREITPPRMFREEFLNRLLARGEYVFVLDRACAQYEPNDPEYQRVTSVTYQHINDNNGFDALRSTRHFGPMAFFLAWFKTIDNLLLEMIETARIEDAYLLFQLFGRIHSVEFKQEGKEGVREYIEKCCRKKAPLELALQAYEDLERQREEREKGIRDAHGL